MIYHFLTLIIAISKKNIITLLGVIRSIGAVSAQNVKRLGTCIYNRDVEAIQNKNIKETIVLNGE